MVKLSKIFKTKGIGFILLAFAAGIILLLLPTEKSTNKIEAPSSVQYASLLEGSLETLLKDVCKRECKVMITLESGYSYTYATNEKMDTTYGENGITTKSVSKEYVIVAKDSEESLVITKENLPKVKGVAIVCKKGSEADKDKITSIVCSLFGLNYENVCCVMG